MTGQRRFRRSYRDDPDLFERLFDLIDIAFPYLRPMATRGPGLGPSWEAQSTPFVRFHGDLAITHVGLLEIPFVLMGRQVMVGGIHAVCTRPEYRRRGYFRQVMTEVLDDCEQRYETLLLYTAQPELYEPFGFRELGEHLFMTLWPAAGGREGFRQLNLNEPSDLRLAERLLAAREPVSNTVGVVHEAGLFGFNEGKRPLHYAEDLEVIVCLELDGSRLKLFDVVGAPVCSLADMIERIPRPIDRVEFYFSPDRFGVAARAVPHLVDGDSHLMVRGPFAAEGQPFMIPRSARC
ncbi:MAG: hypothetical protein ETSY2_38905 [Candidatus Entotheonella gemina]|uniref:N-acetyltransferase domain-containing protein n=1 Tax=Candidatus Entotheonella gemina TaxID=1429439 RepID=W4LRJ9_9BACT|nr:MAG: hypothetical protein ETSY2_38905 [Candidatus Entotheonella gemina]